MLSSFLLTWHPQILVRSHQIDITRNSGGISSDDHALLRVSPIAENELMNLTMGDETALTGDCIRTILDRVKNTLTTEKDKIIFEEKSKYQTLCTDRDCIKDQNEKIGSNLYWVSGRLAKIITLFTGVIGFSILILSIVVTTFLSSPFLFNSVFLSFIIVTLFCIAIIFGLMNWYKGITLKEILNKLEIKIHENIFHYLENILIKGKE
ncbi:MAG: hypothetical protein GX654_02815 [Desulfatiglans sp.]|jgi:type IV secretory pathway VirB2 component (pilin)|nr:hypothetical protein [Desulfatiglans sp.]